jgi:ADP-ribose pyrophosphatase YjhB (NUDIX family)
MPGGFLADGEDPIKGLQREAREELGVSLKDIRYLGIYMDAYKHQYCLSTLNIVYQAKVARGRLRAMSDVSAVQWFTKSKIPWARLAFPKWMKPAIRDWLNK